MVVKNVKSISFQNDYTRIGDNKYLRVAIEFTNGRESDVFDLPMRTDLDTPQEDYKFELNNV